MELNLELQELKWHTMEYKGLIHQLKESAPTYSPLSVEQLKSVFSDVFFSRAPEKQLKIYVYVEEGLKNWKFYLKEYYFIKRLKRQYDRKR